MKYCPDCAEKHDLPEVITKYVGKCYICGDGPRLLFWAEWCRDCPLLKKIQENTDETE